MKRLTACARASATHIKLMDFGLYKDNSQSTRMGFDPRIAGTADTGLTFVPWTLLQGWAS